MRASAPVLLLTLARSPKTLLTLGCRGASRPTSCSRLLESSFSSKLRQTNILVLYMYHIIVRCYAIGGTSLPKGPRQSAKKVDAYSFRSVADSSFHFFGVQYIPDTPKNSSTALSSGMIQPILICVSFGGTPFNTKLL